VKPRAPVAEFVAVAFMSWGKWVARCPRPGCLNAEQRGRCDDGTTGGLDRDRFTCRASHGGCGLQCGVDWPANIADLERVLLARPVPATRNWSPGETLHALVAENIERGLVPSDALNGGPSRGLLEIGGDHLVAGELEFAPDPTRQVT
jgi:hypothetical protein